MKIKSLFILLLLCFSVNVIFGTVYFIDSEKGNDINSGKSLHDAWKSIHKVNNSAFQPGDSILFKSGCTWREELVLSSSGSLKYPIVISSYGYGEKPKILGSNRIEFFEKIGSNYWKAETTGKIGWIWFRESSNKFIWGKKKGSKNELKSNYEFYIDSNVVWFYSDINPVSEKLSLEVSVRDFGIISGWYGIAKKNIVINNLEICFTKNSNIRQIGGTNWEIKNIDSHHSGALDESDGQGIQIEGNNNTISSSRFYENGQHGIFISSFGNSRVKNNLIEQNIIFNNYHTGIDLMNDGGDVNSHQNTVIRRNYIYDETDFEGNEVGIQTLAYGKGLVKNVIIHHNILQNINGIGISIVKNSDSIYVHNNTIYESKSACISLDNGNGYAELVNNIGINNNYYAVVFLHSVGNKVIDYNIWYTDKNTSTNNIFIDDLYYNDLLKYQNRFQFDSNGFFNDPKLVLTQGKIVGLSEDSYCINSGKVLNYSSDYFRTKIIDEIDIGAIEFKRK